MSKCGKVYLDRNGKPSAIYAQALDKYGPEMAEEIYIRHMLGEENIRFSKAIIPESPKVEDIIKENKSLKHKDTGKLKDTSMYGDYLRMSTLMSSWQGKKLNGMTLFDTKTDGFDIDKAAEKVAIRRLGKELASELGINDATPTRLKKLVDAEPERLAATIQDVKNMWAGTSEWGTYIHNVMENSLNELTKWENKNHWTYQKEDYDLKDYAPPINKFVEQAFKKVKFKHNGPNTYDFEDVLKSFLATKMEMEKRLKTRLKVFTEVKLKSENMRPGKIEITEDGETATLTPMGIAGTADIILQEDNPGGILHLMDFKTKSEESAEKMYNAFDNKKIGGPFSNSDASPAEKARIQMSGYAAMLREKGFDVHPEAHVVMISGIYEPEGSSKKGKAKPVGERNYRFSKLFGSRTEMKSVSLTPEVFQDYFNMKEPDDLYKHYQDQGIGGAIINWARDPLLEGLTNEDSNKNVDFIKDNKERYIKNKLNTLYTDKATGRKYFRSLVDHNNKIFVNTDNQASVEKALGDDYEKYKGMQASLPSDIRSYFMSKGKENRIVPKTFRSKKQQIVEALLHGLDPKTHDLHRAQEYMSPHFNDVGPDVLIAVNKKTGSYTLISALATQNNNVNFTNEDDGSGEKRTSIFGRYVTDKDLELEGVPRDAMVGKAHDFMNMKLAAIAMRLNKINEGKGISIDSMRTGSVAAGGSGANITSVDMAVEISKLRGMQKYAGEDFPTELTELLSDPRYSNPAKYGMSATDQIVSMTNQGIDPMSGVRASDMRKSLEAVAERKANGEMVDYDLKYKLAKYKSSLYYHLQTSKGLSQEAILRHPDYMLVNRALLEVQGFNLQTKRFMKNHLGATLLRNANTSDDAYLQSMQRTYNEANAKIRQEFEKFNDEHQKVLQPLIKAKNAQTFGKNIVGGIDYIFKDMFINYDMTKKDTVEDRENLMRLKYEGHPEWNSLTKEEQDYIKFFEKVIPQSLAKTNPKNSEQILNGEYWDKSLVPLIRKSNSFLTKESFRNGKAFGKAVTDYAKHFAKEQGSQKSNELDFEYTTKFADQASNSGLQHSDSRMEALGISDDTSRAWPVESFNTNLADIAVQLAVTGSEAEHLNLVAATYSATQDVLTDVATANQDINSVSDLKAMLKDWKEMMIFERVKEEGDIARAVDATNKIASKVVFSYSARQAVTEFCTGAVQSTSSMIANQVQKFLFRDKEGARFTPKDWAWAGKTWFSGTGQGQNKLAQIVFDHGMITADSTQLKKDGGYKGATKVELFKTKSAHHVNQMFFFSSITQTFLAEMKNKGIVDAYVEKDGKWVYDEKLDKRFHVWDGKSNEGKPTNEEEWKKYQLYKATKESVASEGLLNEDGSMQIPLTSRQKQEIKHYATRLYGSFSKDAQVMGQMYTVGRAMLRYKGWFAQKLANYYTKTHTSEFYGEMKWIEDPEYTDSDGNQPGGFYQWTGEDFEGIFQSVGNLFKDIYRTGFDPNDPLKSFKGMTRIQKENLSKLLADLLLLLFSATLVLPIVNGNEWFKEGFGKTLKKGLNNGLADLNVFQTGASMGDKVFPGVNTVLSSVGNILSGVRASMMDDGETAAKHWNSTLKVSGAYDTGSNVFNAITGD